jgi:hypothetical protein
MLMKAAAHNLSRIRRHSDARSLGLLLSRRCQIRTITSSTSSTSPRTINRFIVFIILIFGESSSSSSSSAIPQSLNGGHEALLRKKLMQQIQMPQDAFRGRFKKALEQTVALKAAVVPAAREDLVGHLRDEELEQLDFAFVWRGFGRHGGGELDHGPQTELGVWVGRVEGADGVDDVVAEGFALERVC